MDMCIVGAACTLQMCALHSWHAKMVFTSRGAPMQDARMERSIIQCDAVSLKPCCPDPSSPGSCQKRHQQALMASTHPLHICMLCISLGLPREIKDYCSCYDLSALHAAQRFLPYLTYTWQHCWKATRWSRVLYWQYAGSSFPSSIPNGAQFVLLTAACSCVLLLDQSLINFSFKFLQQKIEWIQQCNFWQLFPGSYFTGLANSS